MNERKKYRWRRAKEEEKTEIKEGGFKKRHRLRQ